MEKILQVKNIEKYYGSKSNLTKAIDNISFDVNKGEFVGIMGASGSGKTTLLNTISTIDKVTSGHIIINGKDITKNEILVSIISDMYFSKQSDFFEKEYNLGKVNSTIDMQYEGSESFSHVLISTTSTNIDEVEKDILDYVEKIKKEPIDEELFDTIKRKKIGELILSSDSLNISYRRIIDSILNKTNVYLDNPISWIGKVGLMYPSDYGYATSGGDTTSREECLATNLYEWRFSTYSDCNTQNWLYDKNNNQWTITPVSSNVNYVHYVTNVGGVNGQYGTAGFSTIMMRPSVYLRSDLRLVGEGTRYSPYEIKNFD